MLNAMRSGAKSKIIKYTLFGLLALATVGLAFISPYSTPSGAGNGNVARIGRDKISAAEFDNLLQRQLRQQNMTAEEAYRNGIPGDVLNQEINSRIFGRAAHDNGIIIDNATAARHLKSILTPLAQQAQITEKEALQRVLSNLGTSEHAFVSSIKNQMATEQLLKTLSSGARAPAQMVNDAIMYRYEWRRGEYFTISAKDAGALETPTEEQLQAHYTAISSEFLLPEYRDFSVIRISAKTLGLDEAVTDEDVRAYYDSHLDSYSKPEQRTVAQIIVADEALAQQIHDEVAQTKELEKAATAAEKGKATFVRDTYDESGMDVELAKAVFDADQGEIVGPLKTPFGWHVIHVEKVTKAQPESFDSVKAGIRKELAGEKQADALYARANEIDEQIAGGQTLAEVAAANNLQVVSFTGVSSEGTDKKGKKIETDLPVFDKLAQAAYTLEEGEASQMVETTDGEFLIVETSKIEPAAEQPYDAVKSEVADSYRRKQVSTLLDTKTTEITEKLQLGESFDSVAKSLGKQVSSTGLVQRGTQPAKASLERGLLPALFSIDKLGQTTNVNGDESVTILRLAERKIDMPKEPKKEDLAGMQSLLDRSMQNDILEQYRNYLFGEYKVVINEDVLARMYNPKDTETDSAPE